MGWANPYIPTQVTLAPASTVAVSNFPASVEVSNDVGNALRVTGSTGGSTVEISNDVGNPIAVYGPAGGNVPVAGTVAVSSMPEVEVKNDTGNPLPVKPTAGPTIGAWALLTGAASAGAVVPAGGRVLRVTCHATVAGSFAVNGGTATPVPAGTTVTLEPAGNLVAPTIVFTGTDSYAVEYVT